jgi:hypothetical protein
MKSNFAEVKVEIVNCPDLSQAPFYLASTGLGGIEPTIVEFGGKFKTISLKFGI